MKSIADEVHAPKRTVKAIKRSFKKVSLTQQRNMALDLFIRACFHQGLSENKAVEKLRRNVKIMYEIFNDPKFKSDWGAPGRV